MRPSPSIALLVLALSAPPILAAGALPIVDAAPLADKVFVESYDRSSPVAGSPLVGLVLGGTAAVAANSVTVIGPPLSNRNVCLRVTTKDGRFSAANIYQFTADAAPALLRMAPLTVQFVEQLRGYPADQVAVRAFVARNADCLPAGALNLPASTPGGAGSNDLFVLANGKSQPAQVALFSGDAKANPDLQPETFAVCQTAEKGANIAYDLICRLPLSASLTGSVQLRLRYSDGFGATDDYFYLVLLPAPAQP